MGSADSLDSVSIFWHTAASTDHVVELITKMTLGATCVCVGRLVGRAHVVLEVCCVVLG